MIRDSVKAEVQVAVRAAFEEVTTELRAAVEQLRHLRFNTIQTHVDRAEASISDEVVESAAAARNCRPLVCSASASAGLSPSNTGQPPDMPSFTPQNMYCSIDTKEPMPPTSCRCSHSLPEASSGDHSSSPASLPAPIKPGRVFDVVSNLEMQCRRNGMRAARQVVGRSTNAAPEIVQSPSDLAELDMSQAVASNPAPDVQLLDLSLAAEPVTSNAAPSHDHDPIDLTQPTETVAAASENILQLDRPPVSSCSMAAPLPGTVAG